MPPARWPARPAFSASTRTPSPPKTCPRGPSCGASSPRASSARGCCRRGTAARRSRRSSRATRATSCCRSAPTTSTRMRWRSCSSASASACACSCARTPTRGSCRASSSRRASATTRSCACGSSRSSPKPSTASPPNSTSTSRPPRWEDDLHAALVERRGEEHANQLYGVYASAFPASYREEYAVQDAACDIDMIESLDPKTDLGMNLHASARAEPGTLRFKIYRRGSRIPLSDTLPMLERLGVRVQFEHPHRVEPAGAPPVWVVDFGLTPPAAARPLKEVRDSFHEAFFGMWSGAVEADPLNRLVLTAGLKPAEIVVLRAYARYLNQTGSALSLSYVEQALAGNPAVASLLVRLFFSRFDLKGKHDEGRYAAEIEAALDEVENLDEDRILRSFLAVVQATTRTNYFLERPYLSFKLDPKRVPGLPQPRPMHEIWVYSPRVEAVHLRGGPVARGGIRWSDRREDFRTEVLGLMKAQMVKNVVIVPVGAKGGFVLKRATAGNREALMKEGVASYQTFLRGMLDISDNLADGKVVPPRRKVWY